MKINKDTYGKEEKNDLNIRKRNNNNYKNKYLIWEMEEPIKEIEKDEKE